MRQTEATGAEALLMEAQEPPILRGGPYFAEVVRAVEVMANFRDHIWDKATAARARGHPVRQTDQEKRVISRSVDFQKLSRRNKC